MMEASRWHLVRHGETDWNREARFQGQADTPLNDIGRAQARAVAERLAGVSFAAAYASDLARVTETAAAVVRGRKLPVTELPNCARSASASGRASTTAKPRRRIRSATAASSA